MTFTTRNEKCQESSTTIALERNGVMRLSLPSGRSQGTKDFAAFNAFKSVIVSLVLDASAEFQKMTLMKTKS